MMKFSTLKSWMIGLAVCLLLTIGLTSCGSDDTPTPEPAIAPTAVPATVAPPTVAPATAPPATVPPATAATAPETTVTQTLTTTTSTTTTVNTASQPASPLAQPASPLAQPGSPLPTPASSAQPTSTKTISTTESSSAPQASAPMIHVISGFATIAEIAKTTAAEAPAKGKATISGVLYDHATDRVIPGNQLYLIPALLDGDKALPPAIFMGARAEHGDVGGKSNEKGQVFLKDIPPGKYYLAVWEPLDWYLSFESAKAPMPLLITLKADQKLDLGLLYVRGE